ncbi:MAG TPA: DNA translocase FtsK 4TM domain-containing protein, partial [Acidimicrobiales bacterium]|nr:DNA translocase FtsK 4TM domain-containing protein [Acidimicrobiales bacterium]
MTTKRRPATSRAAPRKAAQHGRGRQGGSTRAAAPPSILRRHAADLWAIGLFTLGVLLALALWGDALGPVGRHVNSGFALLVGWARVILPLVSAGAGTVLILERERPDPLRTGIGAALGLVGVCGLAELAQGAPKLSSSPAVRGAGGWVGVIVGRPLHAGIGSAGASVL